MKTKHLSDKELKSLIPNILKEWENDELHGFMAISIWGVIEADRSLEAVVSPMCTSIRLWISGYLSYLGHPPVDLKTQNAITVSMLEQVFASARKMK